MTKREAEIEKALKPFQGKHYTPPDIDAEAEIIRSGLMNCTPDDMAKSGRPHLRVVGGRGFNSEKITEN